MEYTFTRNKSWRVQNDFECLARKIKTFRRNLFLAEVIVELGPNNT